MFTSEPAQGLLTNLHFPSYGQVVIPYIHVRCRCDNVAFGSHPRMCLAIPARVVEGSTEHDRRALVEVAGVRRYIDTGLLEENPPCVGDWVLVHVGFAMSKISEEQALDQLRTLAMLGEQTAVVEEMKGYDSAEPTASADSFPVGDSPP